MPGKLHDELVRHEEVKTGSDRSFAWVFTGFFLLVVLAPLRHGQPVRVWSVAFAAVFLAAGAIRPEVLHPLNVLWMRFGLLLGRFVNPVVLAALFYLVFTPLGLLMRFMGKDPLRLRKGAPAESYWITRTGTAGSSMKNQF
jgi:hypothetical protein